MQAIAWCGKSISVWAKFTMILWTEILFLAFNLGKLQGCVCERGEYSFMMTISIGAVHLVLSTLPQKVLRIVSAFGWKADKHLGFALLKLCVEERRIRSPMASLM